MSDDAGVLVEGRGGRGSVRHGAFELGRHECAHAGMAGGVDEVDLDGGVVDGGDEEVDAF